MVIFEKDLYINCVKDQTLQDVKKRGFEPVSTRFGYKSLHCSKKGPFIVSNDSMIVKVSDKTSECQSINSLVVSGNTKYLAVLNSHLRSFFWTEKV